MAVTVSNTSDLNYTAIASEAYSYYPTTGSVHEYVFEAIGTFSTSASPGDISFTILDAAGVSGANPMSLSGTYYLIESNELTQIHQTTPVTSIT
jgi:hypothetical protein